MTTQSLIRLLSIAVIGFSLQACSSSDADNGTSMTTGGSAGVVGQAARLARRAPQVSQHHR